MKQHAKATFEVKGWDEKTYLEREGGAKLTRATVTMAFHGDLEGECVAEYLLSYDPDGVGTYVGHQHVKGRLAGRGGSFVLQITGTFRGHEAEGHWTVVPGSGAGELKGLRGEGGFVPAASRSVPCTLDFELP